MLHEAELFVQAEQVLVEVLGRIRTADHDIVLPPMFPQAARPMTMAQALQQQAQHDAQLAAVLGDDAATPGPLPGGEVAQAADAACAAARRVADGDALVRADDRDVAVRDLLLEAALARSLLAHYVAAYLGSTACPLPEELARPLWELTSPHAPLWRERGFFREPMPLPDHVSWRDRFLLTAGHEPHPLGH